MSEKRGSFPPKFKVRAVLGGCEGISGDCPYLPLQALSVLQSSQIVAF